jgi:hypothetical protein
MGNLAPQLSLHSDPGETHFILLAYDSNTSATAPA